MGPDPFFVAGDLNVELRMFSEDEEFSEKPTHLATGNDGCGWRSWNNAGAV